MRFIQFLILLLFSFEAQAFSSIKLDKNVEDIYSKQNVKPLKAKDGALSWEFFAKTKEIEKCGIDKDGFDYCLIKPIYSTAIKALDNKEVVLMGFMFPLEQSEKQKNFLLGPYPASCPFHYHSNQAQIVEVLTLEPIKFSYDPIKLKGTLSVKYNEETGIFYYLKNAKIIK